MSEPETHKYTYMLKSGEKQNRLATISKESREWKRFWIPCRLYKETIDVEFNDEVGERTGGWKGVCTGCGYDMLKGETPHDTLRRMEAAIEDKNDLDRYRKECSSKRKEFNELCDQIKELEQKKNKLEG